MDMLLPRDGLDEGGGEVPLISRTGDPSDGEGDLESTIEATSRLRRRRIQSSDVEILASDPAIAKSKALESFSYEPDESEVWRHHEAQRHEAEVRSGPTPFFLFLNSHITATHESNGGCSSRGSSFVVVR